MANVRRISTDEVIMIFDCLLKNKAPPECLQFQIIPAGTSGIRLSPPPYEYQGSSSLDTVKSWFMKVCV